MFHHFDISTENISLPDKFTYPFNYIPHQLSVAAAEQLKKYLDSKEELKEEIARGKMFGVMVVKNQNNEIGFIAAFSGILNGKNILPYFVPPIYDLLDDKGFFKVEEKEISLINEKIDMLSKSEDYVLLKRRLENIKSEKILMLTDAKISLKANKEKRAKTRAETSDEKILKKLIDESQFEKAEYKRLEKKLSKEILDCESQISEKQDEINSLKTERKERSAALQKKMFDKFVVLNANGGSKNLTEIFSDYLNKLPPAGAGECAAPKLLQYAFKNKLTPISMAEFWLGESPKREIRHSGYFYPACKAKCEPILDFMLKGLNVEENPLKKNTSSCLEPRVIYEDEYILVIDKPSGLISVPGKESRDSLYDLIKNKYFKDSSHTPYMVHRLDMDTSGIIVVAKTKEAYKNLQAQFKNHTINKRYVAIVEGNVKGNDGEIDLPLCLNPNERPFQVVDYKFGKRAVTLYKVLERDYKIEDEINIKHGFDHIKNSSFSTLTKIHFFPITGRTHQLRVHSSHQNGLNAPIKGDPLYGKKGKRLFLHAEYIEFDHPISGKRISFQTDPEF
ncbi:MAG: pseudouridine synthase [Bacteroidales bacterium]|nr:pseudouridine synthase [Bacteroidales bacterium]